MPIPLGLLAAGIPSLVKGVSGLFQIGKGNRLARQNVRPVQTVNENIAKNVALAEQMEQVGLPQEQYNQALQNINRNQSGALMSLGRSANPSAGLASLLRASNDAALGLDVQNANTRLNNQRFAFGQRANLAQEQKDVFNWNNKMRYTENAAAAQALKGSGIQNAFGALTDLSKLGQSFFAGKGGQQDDSMMPNQLGGLSSAAQPSLYSYNNKFNGLV